VIFDTSLLCNRLLLSGAQAHDRAAEARFCERVGASDFVGPKSDSNLLKNARNSQTDIHY